MIEELYKVSSQKSKEKCLRFFGEQSVPIQVGEGSSDKLKNFFVSCPSLTTIATPLQDTENEGIKLTLENSPPIARRRYSMPVSKAAPLLNRSTEKIQKMLGSTCPVDVSINNITENGLVSLLQSKLPLCFFLAYLIEQRIPEILFFIVDCREFETRLFDSFESQKEAAHMIFQLYLSKSSPLEANFTHKARLACASQIKSNTSRSCFESPQAEAMVLLEEAFVKFRNTRFNSEMRSTIGNSQIHDGRADRRVRKLVQEVLKVAYVVREDDIRDDPLTMDRAGYFVEGVGQLPFLNDSDRLARVDALLGNLLGNAV